MPPRRGECVPLVHGADHADLLQPGAADIAAHKAASLGQNQGACQCTVVLYTELLPAQSEICLSCAVELGHRQAEEFSQEGFAACLQVILTYL